MSRSDGLGSRQREIAELVARGASNEQIARRLGLSPGSVAESVHRTMRRLGLATRLELALWVARSIPSLVDSTGEELPSK